MKTYFAPVCLAIICYVSILDSVQTQKIGQPLLCHGCVAVIKELHKGLKDSSGRKKAIEQKVKSLCEIPKFVAYTFSPPKMIKACNYIVETHKKELIENLVSYYKKFKTEDNLDLQQSFCEEVIKACEGVRRPETDEEMTPRGLSMADANKKLKSMAGGDVEAAQEQAVLEKPPAHPTAAPKEEL